jgi:hypothetical protein
VKINCGESNFGCDLVNLFWLGVRGLKHRVVIRFFWFWSMKSSSGFLMAVD